MIETICLVMHPKTPGDLFMSLKVVSNMLLGVKHNSSFYWITSHFRFFSAYLKESKVKKVLQTLSWFLVKKNCYILCQTFKAFKTFYE